MPLRWPGAILSLFYPPIFREWLWSHSAMSEREKEHFLWRFLRIGCFISVHLFAGMGPGGWGLREEKRVSERKRKIFFFFLLLNSHRCAGMVTLATNSGAERLIGLCACFCREGRSVWMENRYALYLQIKIHLFQIKAVSSSFWVVCVF